jgi:ribonuclease D
MTNPPIAPARYIDNNTALHNLVTNLENESLVAIDTESNSLYAYRERVCLIQLSTRTADYIIDPLRIEDMQPLGGVLADRKIEKIFHSAEYDVMTIKRDFGFQINNLFDTQLAARILGRPLFGLGDLLEAYIGIQPDKRHQRDDWGERPLPKDSLLYAQMDTHYLPYLRDRLRDELEEAGYWIEAQEAFEELDTIPSAISDPFDPDGYWKIGSTNNLSRRQMAILREVYLLRERLAQQRDCPPFKVFGNPIMVALAQLAPRTRDQLEKVKALSPKILRRYGHDLLQAVERGLKAKAPPPPPRPPRMDPIIMERFNALREWRKGRATARGVESDVIVSKDVLWILAERAPANLNDMQGIPGLGPWRLSHYGNELLEVIRRG